MLGHFHFLSLVFLILLPEEKKKTPNDCLYDVLLKFKTISIYQLLPNLAPRRLREKKKISIGIEVETR